MSRWVKLALVAALSARAGRAGLRASQAKEAPRNYGIGHAGDAGGDRRLGHRRAAGRAGAASGQRLGEGRREGLHGQMRRLPRRVRRKRRALAAARAGQGHARDATIRSRRSARISPMLSSVFDYVRRAMPFGDAQSLTQRRALRGRRLSCSTSTTSSTTSSCCRRRPGRRSRCRTRTASIDDDRETTEKAFWNENPCMKDCRAPVKITGARRGDRRHAGRQEPHAGRGGVGVRVPGAARCAVPRCRPGTAIHSEIVTAPDLRRSIALRSMLRRVRGTQGRALPPRPFPL